MHKLIRFGSLRIRILAWSFIPTTIILLAVALVILFAYQQVTEDLVAGKNRELARLSASQVSSDLEEYANQLVSLAQNPDIRLGIDSLQRIALARAKSNTSLFDAGVVIMDNHGRVNAAEPMRPELIDADWSERSYFWDVVGSKHVWYSDFLVSGEDRVMVIAVPILGDQDAFRGVIAGHIRLEPASANEFHRRLGELRTEMSGSTMLVDSTGRVIYHADPAQIGRDKSAEPAVQRARMGQVGNLRSHDAAGNEVLASYAPVPGTAWGIVIEENWSAVLASSRGYGQFLLVLLALGVVIPALVVAFGVKRITDPLRRLIVAAQQIAGGKFGEQIVVQTGDELEELVKQFNVMSKELAESYTHLEQRVELRTRDLTTLNAIAEVVSGSLDLYEILDAALVKAMESIQMEVGAAYSVQETDGGDEDKHLVLAADRGLAAEFSQRFASRPVRGTAIQTAADAQKPVIWLMSDYPDSQFKHALELEGVRQVIDVPLFAKGKLVGTFNLGTRRERALAPEEISLLAGIGHQVAIAVENARLYDQAEQSAALAERSRLARELHDSVTQSLYSVTMYAEAAQLLLTGGNHAKAAEHLCELRDTAQEALREMRLLIYELRPVELQKRGLEGALQERLETVEARGGIKTKLEIDAREPLPRAMQHELYHIAREALNNTLKHARAKQVSVHLCSMGDTLCLEICDDGVGFDPANQHKGGLGLSGIRERVQQLGGDLQINTMAGEGTTIRVQVPFPGREKE